MALEAVVFTQDPFTYYNGYKDFYPAGSTWSHDCAFQPQDDKSLLGIVDNNIDQTFHAHKNWDSLSPNSMLQNVKSDQWDSNSSPEACAVDQSFSRAFPPSSAETTVTATTGARRKRRRTKSTRNKEEIENQRMTHIAVERNRRKQMNEYLTILRSLMPPSYVQRGDQASIVGGAINFVKELEQVLQSMEGQRKTKQQPNEKNGSSSLFAEFFTFPQYTTRATGQCDVSSAGVGQNQKRNQNQQAVADIEVTMVDSHANMKILSKKRAGQLMKMVLALQGLGLGILHLNVTTVEEMVLYTLSVKVEEGCQLNSVDEIAATMNELLGRIEEEAAFS